MRIISTFRDYYDGVMNTGIDKSVIYVRNPIERHGDFAVPGRIEYQHRPVSGTHGYVEVKYVIVGFCGKLYPGAELYANHDGIRSFDHVVTFDVNVVHDFGSRMIQNYGEKWAWSMNKRGTDIWFESVSKRQYLIDLFHKEKVPVFSITANERAGYRQPMDTLTLNPRLLDYDFQKVIDPYTAFQELSMYIGGVLGSYENEILEVSEKVKIEQHGFDKWSFRNPSPGRKARKNK